MQHVLSCEGLSWKVFLYVKYLIKTAKRVLQYSSIYLNIAPTCVIILKTNNVTVINNVERYVKLSTVL